MSENLESEWTALGALCHLAGASLLGMGEAVWCLHLLIMSRCLAVGGVPLRQTDLKDTGHCSVQRLRHLLPPALSSLSLSGGMLWLQVTKKVNQE